MNLKYGDILYDLSNIINLTFTGEQDFYETILLKIGKVFNCNFLGLFFINGDEFQQKCFVSKTKKPDYNKENADSLFSKSIIDKDIISIFKEKNSTYFVVKLFIKNSLFAFLLLNTKEDILSDEKNALLAYSSIFSYMIKDFELGGVFKMQLGALQNAIQEKNDALKTIEKQNQKLIEADEFKNNFIASMSHDLRTPLNSIIGFSEALNSEIFGGLNEKQKEYIKDIQTSSLYLLNMMNEVLDFSKIEASALKLNATEFSPEIIINEIITILSPLSDKKNIKIKFENKCESNIYADLQKFQQILYNLLTNSIKYTNNNGLIKIKTEENSRTFILKVEDNGVGIEKKYLDKIFDKFFYLENHQTTNEKSTGLGLAITKEFVKMHGGEIFVKSKPCKGTVFEAKLYEIIK